MIRFKFRRQRQQADHPQHDRVAVFIGKEHELKLSGELVMSEEEFFALQTLGDLQKQWPDVQLIVEDRFGSPIP